ncbi:tellurite resistance TerB family protein [Rhodoflexus caldus]|uniref:tellurite resistance TerB family protein n=1 Tax=Rhodoflexus caldus TaxID=2891236 RepID=UPI00202A9059|nr:hypothetical protein [Rhodoflexus caldus]
MMTEELKGYFKNLYRMMLSDDDIHEQELSMLYQLAIDKGFTEQDIDSFLGEPIESDEMFAPHDTLIKIEYLYDLARMAWADGNIDDREKDTLLRFCTAFGFAEENIPLIIEFLLEEAKRGASKQSVMEQVKQNL